MSPILGWLVLTWVLFSSLSQACEWSSTATDQNSRANAWKALSQLEVVGVFDQPVRLLDGLYQGLPFSRDGHSRPELRLWPELLVSGDLDGHSGNETVGLLSETSGGSGERVYLFAAKSGLTGYTAWPAALVGDRVKVRSLKIQTRRIFVDVVAAAAGQPLCCGTEMSQNIWQLQNQQLALIETHVQGPLSLQTVQGRRWRLLAKASDKPQTRHHLCIFMAVAGKHAEFEINGRHYSTVISESQPGQIQIANVQPQILSGLTADATLESSFLKKLASINQYSFRAGHLVLLGTQYQQPFALEFAEADRPDTD